MWIRLLEVLVIAGLVFLLLDTSFGGDPRKREDPVNFDG
jgi:hypothetical protein